MICIRTRRIFRRGSNPKNSLSRWERVRVRHQPAPYLSRHRLTRNNRPAILNHRAGRQVPALCSRFRRAARQAHRQIARAEGITRRRSIHHFVLRQFHRRDVNHRLTCYGHRARCRAALITTSLTPAARVRAITSSTGFSPHRASSSSSVRSAMSVHCSICW